MTSPVAVVLPAGETFSPVGSGAIALLAHALALQPSPYSRVVVGRQCPNPYDDVPFMPVRPAYVPGRQAARYAAGIASRLAPPCMIEVHNRADVALSLCRRYPGVPVSLVCHNDPLAMRGLQTGPERRHALRRLAGIVCVSDHLARRLIAQCAGAAPVVIPNGIDLAALPPPVAPRQNLILFAGRLVADKGADAFVSACRLALPALPGWHAEMIGADRFHPDARQTKFTAALASAARAVPVTMSGYRPAAEVMVAMARAAIVVVPSRWEEPFGLTALEAMANGAALICSNRGGLAEVTGDVAIPCDPDDPAGMAAAIRHLAGNAAERARRGAAGRARAQAFDLARTEVALDAYRDRLNPDRMERGQDA